MSIQIKRILVAKDLTKGSARVLRLAAERAESEWTCRGCADIANAPVGMAGRTPVHHLTRVWRRLWAAL